jgi:hypothetical protein
MPVPVGAAGSTNAVHGSMAALGGGGDPTRLKPMLDRVLAWNSLSSASARAHREMRRSNLCPDLYPDFCCASGRAAKLLFGRRFLRLSDASGRFLVPAFAGFESSRCSQRFLLVSSYS